MKIFTSSTHPDNDHVNEMKPMPVHRSDPIRPVPPHERKELMRIEFDDNDWNVLQEVFGDPDSAIAAASILMKGPPELRILAVQILKMIQKEED